MKTHHLYLDDKKQVISVNEYFDAINIKEGYTKENIKKAQAIAYAFLNTNKAINSNRSSLSVGNAAQAGLLYQACQARLSPQQFAPIDWLPSAQHHDVRRPMALQ